MDEEFEALLTSPSMTTVFDTMENASMLSPTTEAPPSIPLLAQDYIIYHLGVGLQTYFLPAIIPIGIMGNIMAFLVMSLPKNRKVACCVLMRALAVSDTIILYIGIHYWMVTTGVNRKLPEWECSYIVYIFQVFNLNGTLLIVLMTVDRFISIAFPYKAGSWVTHVRAQAAVVMVVLLMLIYNIPYALYTKVVGKNTCTSFGIKTSFSTTFSYVSLCINSVGPFGVLLILNCLIIYNLKKHRDSMKQGKDDEKSKKKSSLDRQLTMMLLLVTFALLLLTGPQYIRYLTYIIYNPRTHPWDFAVYILFVHVSNKLSFVNACVNFFLYCMGGSKFRKQAISIVTCGRGFNRVGISESVTGTSGGGRNTVETVNLQLTNDSVEQNEKKSNEINGLTKEAKDATRDAKDAIPKDKSLKTEFKTEAKDSTTEVKDATTEVKGVITKVKSDITEDDNNTPVQDISGN